MRSLWNHIEEIFGADNGKQVGLKLSVESRKEDATTGFDEGGAGSHDRCRIRNVLQHFHAGHVIKTPRSFFSQSLNADLAIVNAKVAVAGVIAGHRKEFATEIDPRYRSARSGQAFTEDAATTANIQDFCAVDGGMRANELKAQRVDRVQGLEFTARIPPTARQCGELFDFIRVYILGHRHHGLVLGSVGF